MTPAATSTWPVPPAFLEVVRRSDPTLAAWAPGAGEDAAVLADRWQLTPDGDPLHGWMAVVWPVVDQHGRRLMLKIAGPDPLGKGEGAALAAWQGRGTVRLHRRDPEARAVLLDRLDPARDLFDVPIDDACAVIGDLLADLAGVEPPAGVVSMADELDDWLVRLDRVPAGQQILPTALVDRARSTITDHVAELRRSGAHRELLHYDLHYLNVLHTSQYATDDASGGWRAIDPLPMAGRREWELIALLRNRWPDAETGGDPDRALRRRLDQVCERAGIDRSLARACAQAAAVDNLLTVLPGNVDSMFNPPFAVMAQWTDG